MIKSATFKLTLWYLGIVMALSLLFSVALYQASYTQLAANVDRQRNAVGHLLLPPELEPRRDAIMNALADQLNDDRRNLLLRLGALNLVTLLLGGGASYVLARRTLEPIEASLEAQGRFTADASHELRTPLTAMRTEIEVALRERGLSAHDARELLASNLEEIAKLEALSAGLLRLARFENALDPAAISAIPVHELFEAAAARHQARLDEHHVSLEVTVGAETVSGDRDSLTELVAILLDNAIKYSPAHSSVKLASKATNDEVRLSVADHGIGIKASDIPRIFDRFYRADPSRTRANVGGYGLGLSIAKRIAEVHHGIISVESKPEKGSTFTVKLPIEYELVKPPFLSLYAGFNKK